MIQPSNVLNLLDRVLKAWWNWHRRSGVLQLLLVSCSSIFSYREIMGRGCLLLKRKFT